MSKGYFKNLNNTITKNNGDMFGGSITYPQPSIVSSPLQSLSSSSSLPTSKTTNTLESQLVDRSEKRSHYLFSRTFLSFPIPPSKVSSITPVNKKLFPSTAKELPCISLTTTKISNKSVASVTLQSRFISSLATPPAVKPAKMIDVGNGKSKTVDKSSTIISGKTKLLQHRHQIQQQQYHNLHHHHLHTPKIRFRILPGLKATSFFTILTLVCLETVLLSTVSNCAKTFYMHWNTSNSIFRIDNTDHIIDVNKGNLAFEFDQVHIICPVYEPGTFENETEKYIIYNVSKVEYETCRITNADPRVIAICDKPQRLMFFTITFRPFTPQPGGLEFLPGNDYYFISTSSKDDLYRRIGGRCSTNNMKVVFKVCCAPEDKNNRTNGNMAGTNVSSGGLGGISNSAVNNGNGNINSNTAIQQQQHNNNININGGGQMPLPKLPGMIGGNGGGIGMNNGGGLLMNGNSGTSINTNIDQYNRIPMQQPTNIGIGNGNMVMNGISNGGGGINGLNGQHSTGIRINNVPSSQQHPSQKNDEYDKHPNEVVKNEELTYNSAAPSLYKIRRRKEVSGPSNKTTTITQFATRGNRSWGSKTKSSCKSIYQKFTSLLQLLLFASNYRNRINSINNFMNFVYNCNPIILTTTILVTLVNLFQYKLSSSWTVMRLCNSSSSSTTKSSSSSSKVPPTTRIQYFSLKPNYSSSSPPKRNFFSPVNYCIMETLR